MVKELRKVYFDKELKIEACSLEGIVQRFPNHFHNYYVIGLIVNGQRNFHCRNADYFIGPGDVIFINPSDNHGCEQADGGTLEYICFMIESSIMLQIVKEVKGEERTPIFFSSVAYQCEYSDLIQELFQKISFGDSSFEKEEIFLFLMEQLLEEYSNFEADLHAEIANDKIKKVQDYIKEQYDENITLDKLQELSGVNKYTLIRAFTKNTGTTPYQYLVSIRIDSAKKMLEKGIDISQAAVLSGFSDQSHFTNFFKKLIGLTPKQYQKIFMENRRK